MGNGYLGKISAIVSANTGDFKPKLDAAAKDVTSFAKSMQSTLASASSASSASLRAIYTEAQKFDRALAAATSRKLSFKGFDAADLGAAADRMRQLYSATNQVSKPLADAAKTFGKLSYEVQGEFLPALISAQKATEALASTISRTGQVGEERFGRVQQKVAAVIASMSRIREADALAGGLATGRELAFQQPGLVAEMQRSRALQAKALALSPEVLAGSQITGLVGQQKAAAAETVRLHSALEKVRNSRNGDAVAAEAALNKQLALYSQINAQIEQQIANIEQAAAARARDAEIEQNTGASSRRMTPVADLLRMRAEDARKARDAEIEKNIGASSRRMTPVADLLRMRAEDERKARDAEIEKNIGASSRRMTPVADLLRIRAEDEERRALQGNPTGVFGPQLTEDMKRARAEAKALDETMSSLRAKSNFIISGDVQNVKQAEAEVSRLIDLVVQLKTEQRKQAAPLIDNAVASLATGDVGKMQASIAKLRGGLVGMGVRGTGDIGRGGFDKFTLAAQQAAFAVDDFFSVTGDMSQRIRAVGNNITQLGFVLGNTTGLVLALAASLGAQGVAAYLKYANGGRTAEMSAKSLNEALAKQKSLVDELRQAFGSLASSIGESVFSGAKAGLFEFAEQLKAVRKEAEKARNESASATDPRMLGIADREKSISERVEGEANPGRAAGLREGLRDLDAAKIRVRRQVDGMQTPSKDELLNLLGRSVSAFDEQVALEAGSPFRNRRVVTQRTLLNDAIRESANAAGGNSFDAVLQRRETVSSQLKSMSLVSPRGDYGLSTRFDVSGQLEGFRQQIELLDRALATLNDESFFRIAESAKKASDKLDQSQESLNSLAEGGFAGARELQNELNAIGARLRSAREQLIDATKIEDAGKRKAAQDEAERAVAAIGKEIEERSKSAAALASASRSIDAFAGALERAGGKLISDVIGEVNADAAKARRDANAAEAAAGAGGGPVARAEADAMQRRRDRVQENERIAQGRGEELARQREAIKARFEADARGGRLDKESQDLIRRRDEAQSQIDKAKAEGVSPPADAERRAADAQRGLDRIFDKSPAAEAARKQADEFDREVTAKRQREELIARGRELAVTPAQKAGAELAGNLRALGEAFKDSPAADRGMFEARTRQLTDDAMRQTAPAIAQLAGSVKASVAMGPSRAALQASDATTSQGAAELNRLIRGDDSAKSQDLAELQRQSSLLQQLIQAVNANGGSPPVLNL